MPGQKQSTDSAAPSTAKHSRRNAPQASSDPRPLTTDELPTIIWEVCSNLSKEPTDNVWDAQTTATDEGRRANQEGEPTDRTYHRVTTTPTIRDTRMAWWVLMRTMWLITVSITSALLITHYNYTREFICIACQYIWALSLADQANLHRPPNVMLINTINYCFILCFSLAF